MAWCDAHKTRHRRGRSMKAPYKERGKQSLDPRGERRVNDIDAHRFARDCPRQMRAPVDPALSRLEKLVPNSAPRHRGHARIGAENHGEAADSNRSRVSL